MIIGDEMDCRLRCFLFRKYDLYVTAGCDCQGNNKLIAPGDTSIDSVQTMPDGMRRFPEEVSLR